MWTERWPRMCSHEGLLWVFEQNWLEEAGAAVTNYHELLA